MEDSLYQQVITQGQSTCPCCDRLVKVYKRKINSTMARALIKLRKLSGEGNPYLHLTEFVQAVTSFGDFAKLRYWGFVEADEAEPERGGKTSGMWRITNKGRDFVDSKRQVWSHVKILDGESIDFTGELVDIQRCLTEKFDYVELMAE